MGKNIFSIFYNYFIIMSLIATACSNTTRTRSLAASDNNATPAPTDILLPVEVAATYLEGILNDESAQEIAGAVVYFEGSPDSGVQADAAGKFRLLMTPENKGKRLIIIKNGVSSLAKVVSVLDIPSAVNSTVSLGKLIVKTAGTITGQVKLLDGTSRAGILVYIPGTNFTTITDAQGNYTITGLPEGSWQVNFAGSELESTTISEIQIIAAQNIELLPQIIMPANQLLAGIALASIDYTANSAKFNFNFTADIAFFKISEDSSFTNVEWTAMTYSTSFIFTGNGNRTAYFKFKSSTNRESSVIAFPVNIIATATPTLSKLAFLSSSPLIAKTNNCAGPFTIQAQDNNNNAISVTSQIEIDLIKNLGNTGTFYTTLGCTGTAITQISIAINESQVQFWFKNTASENATLTANIISNPAATAATRSVVSIAGDPPGTWSTAISTPSARVNHTAVWTGTEMIIWGGINSSLNYLNTGSRYDLLTNAWTDISNANAPTARALHSAVWTGSEMIIWGGSTVAGIGLSNGGKYNLVTNTWNNTISSSNAPSARESHSAVWTGSEMIIWGGNDNATGFRVDNGKKYNPVSNTWTATISSINAPTARWRHSAVWTGSKMIIWGGDNNSGVTNTGKIYNPTNDTWEIETSLTNASVGRYAHSAIWTGSEMIVWGGCDNNSIDLNTGGRYNPNTNTWENAASLSASIAPRNGHSAVWSDLYMIIYGGSDSSNNILSDLIKYSP